MRYRDIIGIEKKSDIGASPILHERCIAWTAGHETALFYVDEIVHPDTVCIWFFPKFFYAWKYNEFTHKYRRTNIGWQLIETVKGMPRLLEKNFNFNPFCPFDKKYTGGHFATCKFPQNYEKHPIGCCKNTVSVECRRLTLGVQE